MKRLISVILAAVLAAAVMTAAPFSADADLVFKEGDVLYLRIDSPAGWADGATLYVNFTDASRAENGDRSVVIADADKSRYNPVTGVTYDSGKGLYSYTVTADDEGAVQMRFWRGNSERLWNDSVALSAEDYLAGINTAVVTDWSASGYITATYEYELDARINLSADSGKAGESFDISVAHADIPEAEYTYEISINGETVSSEAEYSFTPEADGIYKVDASVRAVKNGKIVAADEKTASITIGTAPMTVYEPGCLYVHAVPNESPDTEAWVKWYKIGDIYYFFLPSSAGTFRSIEIYSTLYADAEMDNGVTIPANRRQSFPTEPGKTYRMTVGDEDNYKTVKFMYSSAEAALWINNTETFDGYSDFFSYLQSDKSNSVAATGAISTPDGKIVDTPIKKIKGRGNTSWNADKKGFNVTFNNNVTLDGMEKCKKFSLISNFQDAAMARNRVLFDIADEVGVPYSSDSRFIDLYTNGVYQGTYQMCQKIDVGKNTLIPDFDEEDYLDTATGGVKSDFCFVTEIDSSPAADDFHFTAKNGNNLTMKSPELDTDDPNYNAVYSYVRNKYGTMYNRLQKDNIGDYLDITSMAEVYIINELGKNWDSGASSFYFTYKPDENGKYKFFASPVWDYDNSLGNANGVSGDLRRMGVTDYTLPTGWFSTKKNGYNGPNVLAESVKNPIIMNEVRRVWFEEFLPALDKLANTKGNRSGEVYSSDAYADILRDTADMNYQIWDLVTNTSWICDHSSLRKYSAEYTYTGYGMVSGVTLNSDSSDTKYDQYTFDGQFDYMMDWTMSRAAWISSQYIDAYLASDYTPGDADLNGDVEIVDATLIQRWLASIGELNISGLRSSDVDKNDDVEVIDATLIQRALAGIPNPYLNIEG